MKNTPGSGSCVQAKKDDDEYYSVGAFLAEPPASLGDTFLLPLLLLPDEPSTAFSALATNSIIEIGAESPRRQPILTILV